MRFFENSIKSHKKSVDTESHEVFDFSLALYRTHLQELENRDINFMKKMISDMKRLRDDLLRELDMEQTKEIAILREKEEIMVDTTPIVMALRKECDYLFKELDEMKESFKDGEDAATSEGDNENSEGE